MTPAKERLPVLAGVALAVVVLAAASFAGQPQDLRTSDFYSFWAGARLIGADLYDPAQAEAIQRAESPAVESKRYIRPPFYAIALWPFGRLPFRPAAYAWWALNAAVLAVFVWAWKLPPASFMLCAAFLPLLWSFRIGQDIPILLAILACSARLIAHGEEILGGACLALCGVKPHLFFLVPVVLLARGAWKVTAGFVAGAATVYLVSAIPLGLDWPLTFFSAALANEKGISFVAPGFSGLLQSLHLPPWLQLAGIAVGVALAVRCARSSDWWTALAFASAAGVVFAPRALIYDASLYLPLLLCHRAPGAVIALGLALSLVNLRFGPLVALAQATSFLVLWLGWPEPGERPA